MTDLPDFYKNPEGTVKKTFISQKEETECKRNKQNSNDVLMLYAIFFQQLATRQNSDIYKNVRVMIIISIIVSSRLSCRSNLCIMLF